MPSNHNYLWLSETQVFFHICFSLILSLPLFLFSMWGAIPEEGWDLLTEKKMSTNVANNFPFM